MDTLHNDLTGWHESAVRRESLRAERRRQQAELHRPGAATVPARARPIELFLFAYDTALYDRSAGRNRIDEVLDEGEREFGGYDQILLWQPYPRVGLCPRNQWDFWADMPGSLPALRALVDRCHRRGTSVLLNYIRWYAAEGAQPCDAHEKFHLLGPGLDRCANVGFRGAADCPTASRA